MIRSGVLWAFLGVVWASVTRDRSNFFFLLALPVLIMLVIGVTFGGQGRITLGVHVADRSAAARIVEQALADAGGLEVRTYDSPAALGDAVRGGGVAAGLEVPERFGDDVAAGRTPRLALVAVGTGDVALTARTAIDGALGPVAARLVAARLVGERAAMPFAVALDRSGAVAGAAGAGVEVEQVGDRPATVSSFAFTAPQNFVLFVFLNGLTSAILLVEARRTGVLARMRATPVGPGTVIAGFGLGWFALCLAQSVLLVLVGVVLFDVRWGDPAGAAALVVVFALVGCGAGLLVGAVARDAERVGAVAPVLGIVLGALGGCMAPLEVFPDTMRVIAGLVPHSWAMTAWDDLIFEGGDLAAILPELAVLAAFAAVLGALGTWILRRELTAGH